jgi:hypothetical protein
MIPCFGCVPYDVALDSFDVSMIMVLHPTHSLVLLRIQMIAGNFP